MKPKKKQYVMAISDLTLFDELKEERAVFHYNSRKIYPRQNWDNLLREMLKLWRSHNETKKQAKKEEIKF